MFRRLVSMPVVLLCVITITFFLMRLSPGGPFDSERKLPAAIEQQLLAKYVFRFGELHPVHEFL